MVKIRVGEQSKNAEKGGKQVAKKNRKRHNGVVREVFNVFLEHVKVLIWPGIVWFVFTASIFLVPYLSIAFTKQLAFLLAILAFPIFVALIVLIRKKVTLYTLRFSSLILSFLFYSGVVAWLSGIFEYNFWDLSLFVDIHPYVLIGGALGLLAMGFGLAQFKDLPQKFLTVLPCVVILWDVLGLVFKLTAPVLGKILSIISVNWGQMYTMYFSRYGFVGMYPDSNFWLITHLLGILFLIPLWVRDYKRKDKVRLVVRSIILVLLLWFLSYPVASITFAYLWGIALFFSGVVFIIKTEFGLRRAFMVGGGLLGLFIALMLIQHLLGIKNIRLASDFFGGANLIAAYKTYDKAIRAHEIMPGIFRGGTLRNLLLGLSIGKLGPIMGLLNFAAPEAVYNGLVVLLLETGILGAIFWGVLIFMLLRNKKNKMSLSYKLVNIAVILFIFWQALTGVSLWSLLLLYLLVFLVDVLDNRKRQEIKLTVDRPLTYLSRFMFYTVAVLGTIVWIFIFARTLYVIRGIYGIKLRQVEAATLNGKEKFLKLEDAFYYAQQTRSYCKSCKLLDIASLQVLTELDNLLFTDKNLLKDLKIDTTYVEQLRYYMLTSAYKLTSDIIIPEANAITAYAFDRLGVRQNSRLLQSLAILKYDHAINTTPTDYKLAYNYAKLLLLQESKKNDITYNRLVSLFKLLAGLASNSASRTVEVALLQGQFYVKYKEYDKAKNLYTKVKDWLSRQTFKNKEDKEAWLAAIDKLIKEVDSYQKSKEQVEDKGSK